VTDGIPPPSRNHRTPTAADTPASAAASSLDSPRAIADQNRCRCSNSQQAGAPATASPADQPDPTSASVCSPQRLLIERLRRPLEFAQYTSFAFNQVLDDHRVLASIGSVGDAYDNAMAESFVDTFKTELIADRVWRTRMQLELAIVEWVAWFNNDRLHESLGDRPPAEVETLHAEQYVLTPSPKQ
jgi:putative transposase